FPLMLRPHPTSPPFPYTTLFRSAAREPILLLGPLIGVRDRTEQDRGRAPCPPQPGQLHLEQRDRVDLGVDVISPVADRLPDKAPDRKSTRLNSSHVEISYAVFCL